MLCAKINQNLGQNISKSCVLSVFGWVSGVWAFILGRSGKFIALYITEIETLSNGVQIE